MPQTILITGGAGFVGRAVARALVARGDRARVLDSLIEQVHGSRARPEGLPDAVELRTGDIRGGRAVAGAVAGVDAVIHLAAQVAVTTSLTDPVTDFAVNLGGTLTLLEALRRRADPPFRSSPRPTRSMATSPT
ncbi:NAD-dependent epimerase/dehydratase family protein [Methylobacterium currus]|uniref:NAD-dependent epimerase/dehydratase family protein n=1 Tax=Methylobacterium currus TaxID=2051553 RepID=UPI0026C77E61